MNGDKRITYTVEDKVYDPNLFTDEGKVLFKQVEERDFFEPVIMRNAKNL